MKLTVITSRLPCTVCEYSVDFIKGTNSKEPVRFYLRGCEHWSYQIDKNILGEMLLVRYMGTINGEDHVKETKIAQWVVD